MMGTSHRFLYVHLADAARQQTSSVGGTKGEKEKGKNKRKEKEERTTLERKMSEESKGIRREKGKTKIESDW